MLNIKESFVKYFKYISTLIFLNRHTVIEILKYFFLHIGTCFVLFSHLLGYYCNNFVIIERLNDLFQCLCISMLSMPEKKFFYKQGRQSRGCHVCTSGFSTPPRNYTYMYPIFSALPRFYIYTYMHPCYLVKFGASVYKTVVVSHYNSVEV